MMLWAVCGARRGVGKTRLSRQLARMLPQAVYAKVGHNPRNDARPANYFTSVRAFLEFYRSLAGVSHCIVESNRPEVRRMADVRVFIAAPPGATDLRPDAEDLRRQADIRIAPREDPQKWEQTVAARLNDPNLVHAVCAAFARQRRFVCRGGDGRDAAQAGRVKERAP